MDRTMMDLLQPHQRRWIERHLEDNDIPFVVIGGVAVKFYCPERQTKDVDLFVAPDPSQTDRLVMSIPAILDKPSAKNGLSSDKTQGSLKLPNHQIDILCLPTGLDFEEAHRTATAYKEGGICFPILSLDLLLRHKQAVAQEWDSNEQDARDVELLLRASSHTMSNDQT